MGPAWFGKEFQVSGDRGHPRGALRAGGTPPQGVWRRRGRAVLARQAKGGRPHRERESSAGSRPLSPQTS